MEDKIQNLQNQVNSLQRKIIQVEQNQRLNFKDALRGTLEVPDATKIVQQDDSTSKSEKAAYSRENDNKINQQVEEPISKGISEASQSPFQRAKQS